MVDYTEPICQLIDAYLAQMLTFDTSGIELYVTENNPKTLNALIKKLKVYYKDNPDVDPYQMAYGLMPSQAASCPDAKQMYINGHFCYADKFAILTNGLEIVRQISYPDFHPDTFLGDSAFDSANLYGILMNHFHFSKALIPYNPRNESTLKEVGYNAYDYPTCPNNPSVDMKYCGVTKKRTCRPHQVDLP
ncbi:MAG: hypothetical protein U0I51_06870 [Muricomes sp.]|uniref:hypothetical protein n=1 Tax=Faecalicatena contorta TaxID=39482 RepID=UPI002E9B253E|nr:hypothetical protein [Muricomes sp.]